MARRRRRGQNPRPYKENGRWKFKYRIDQAQADGSVRRVQKTKVLGRTDEMTYSEACRESRKFVRPIDDLELGIEYSDFTLGQLVEKWRNTVKANYRLSTQFQYESMLRRWILPMFENVSLLAITKEDVQSLLTRAGRKLSYESVKGLRKVLRHIFSVAEDWGRIERGANPTKGRLRLPPRVRRRPPRILTPMQMGTLLAALPEPHATVVMTAVFVGLRKGELEALRRNDLVSEGLVVDEAIYYRQVGAPKTGRSNGVVPLGLRTRKAIENWLNISRFKEPDDFIFSTKVGKPIDLHNSIRRIVKPTCRKLGIPEVSWHDLRHTFTAWGRQAGVNAETMRDLLRHTDVRTTLNVYSQACDAKAAVAKIEELLPLNVTPQAAA